MLTLMSISHSISYYTENSEITFYLELIKISLKPAPHKPNLGIFCSLRVIFVSCFNKLNYYAD